MASDPERNVETEKIALDHAWAWFALHANQRLQSVNFFLIAMAFLSAAFVAATKERMHAVASGVAILAATISFLFYRVERRIRSLLHAAEDAIDPLQERLARSIDLEAIRIVSRVEDGKPGEWKYSKVFRYLYFITGATFILGLLYVSWSAWSENPETKTFSIVVQAVLGIFFVLWGYEMISGLPRMLNADRSQITARWLMLAIGTICVVTGIVIACNLVFFHL